MNDSDNTIGLIIPTLGDRESIIKTIKACLSCERVKRVVVVKPPGINLILSADLTHHKKLIIVDEERKGLASAINLGLRFIQDCSYWNWCGDDDSISIQGMTELVDALATSPDFFWGSGSADLNFVGLDFCFESRLSKFKITCQRFGPNLIAQPPLLFDVKITQSVGGLDERFFLAFDQDIIQKFAKKSAPLVIAKVTGTYNWHPDTLSNRYRRESQIESLKIRFLHADSNLEKLLIVFLYPISTLAIWSLNFILIGLYNLKAK